MRAGNTEAAYKALYYIQQREGLPWKIAASGLADLPKNIVVMVQTEHGLEPAQVMGIAPITYCLSNYDSHCVEKKTYFWEITDIAEERVVHELATLHHEEKKAFELCSGFVEKRCLKMKLVRVEQFYDKSKMVFYFTAENRVDFRGLVKDLVQQYRTRIEMRQIGVRHETKMLGGLGICGRELCCSKYLDNFSSISVKMAKEQDLPLNPNKISGLCNRLFCCLTHECESYKKERRTMPRPGWRIVIDGEEYLVQRQNVLHRRIIAVNSKGEETCLEFEQWSKARQAKSKHNKQEKRK